MNKVKLMLLAAAVGLGASAMAQSSASWTFYCPDNIKHQGTQTNHTIVVKTRTAPTLADFNNDGKLEMVYGGQNTGDWDWVYEEFDKDGSKVTDWHWTWTSNYNNSGFVIGFNGWDSDPVRLDGKVDYWSFQTDTYGIPLGTNNFYRWIDFDNDGNLDLIMFARRDYDNRGYNSDYYALIYQNGGEAAGYKFTQVDKAPFNVVDGTPGFNPHDGWLDNEEGFQLGRANRGLTFGDINNDGIVDLVSQNQAGLKIWIGKGDGAFECIETIAENNYREGDVKLADLDGDGNLDFVVSGWASGVDYVNFYKGNGDGTFELKNPSDKRNIRSSGVAVADFNNDGKLDVLIMGYSDQDSWTDDLYLGNGDFTFTRKAKTIDDSVDGCVCYAFDVDNDGNIDLLANHGTNLKWWRGNGNGTFQGTGYCNNKQSSNKAGGGFSFGDVYNRNMLDQAICYKEGDNAHVGIIPGRTGDDGNGALNQAPSAPTNVVATVKNGIIEVTWTAGNDDKTPQQSLAYNVYVKYGDKVRCIVPALTETGRLKVVQDMQTLVYGTSYKVALPADAKGELEIGVQTIDGVFAPSAFAKATIKAELTDGEDVAAAISALNITVAHATYKRTVADGQYATVILPFAAELPENEMAYELSEQEVSGSDIELVFKPVDSFEANKPYLVGGAGFNEITADDVTLSFAPTSTSIEAYGLEGTYTKISNVEGYVLKKAATETTFYKSNGATVPAFHCYLKGTSGAVKLKILFDEPTGIREATTEELRQFFNIYSIDGRRVRANAKSAMGLPKGAYIINGKKIVVK